MFFPYLHEARLCAISNLALICVEGSYCKLENGKTGMCKKIQECPSKLREVIEGKRNSDSMGRCGFQDFTEIVCCQVNITDKIGLRPAEIGMISSPHLVWQDAFVFQRIAKWSHLKIEYRIDKYRFLL